MVVLSVYLDRQHHSVTLEVLSEYLEELRNHYLEDPVIVGGACNGRIARLNQIYEELTIRANVVTTGGTTDKERNREGGELIDTMEALWCSMTVPCRTLQED